MKRRFTFGTLLALVLVLGMTVTAMAAGPGPNAENAAVPGTAGQGAALNGTFVDENPADGVCDSYAQRSQAENGTGKRWGGGQGYQADQGTPRANFVDGDGDGVCDSCGETHPQDGASQQMRRGGGQNQ